MGARTKARKGALDILYESEMRGLEPGGSLPERQAADPRRVRDYTVALVEGVAAHREEIDKLISANTQGWALARLPAVDRNLLRIAIYELVWQSDVPKPVVINEAVALATDLSTDASPGFLNGVLAAVAEGPLPDPTPTDPTPTDPTEADPPQAGSPSADDVPTEAVDSDQAGRAAESA